MVSLALEKAEEKLKTSWHSRVMDLFTGEQRVVRERVGKGFHESVSTLLGNQVRWRYIQQCFIAPLSVSVSLSLSLSLYLCLSLHLSLSSFLEVCLSLCPSPLSLTHTYSLSPASLPTQLDNGGLHVSLLS